MIRRASRATVRTIRRLVRPLRLRIIDWHIKQSLNELTRLKHFRTDLADLERIEYNAQAALFIRRIAVERGW